MHRFLEFFNTFSPSALQSLSFTGILLGFHVLPFLGKISLRELQTHPNLHFPVWVGSRRGRPQRGGTNLDMFVPIWGCWGSDRPYRNKRTQICAPSLGTTALWPYSNGAVQLRSWVWSLLKNLEKRVEMSTSWLFFDSILIFGALGTQPLDPGALQSGYPFWARFLGVCLLPKPSRQPLFETSE